MSEQKLREAVQRIKDDTILDRQDADYYKRILLVHISWCKEALSQPPTSDEGAPTETPLTDAEVERLYGPISDTFWTSLAGRFAKFTRQLERTLHAKERELANVRKERDDLYDKIDKANGLPLQSVSAPQEHAKLLDWLKTMRRGIPSHGTYGEDAINAYECLRSSLTRSAPQEGKADEAIGHEGAQKLIAHHVQQIQILSDHFGYDPTEWLNDETAQDD